MFTYIFNYKHHFLDTQQEDNIFDIMGQFLDYISNIFRGNSAINPVNKENKTNQLGFDTSFTNVFKSNDAEAKAAKISNLMHSNKKTIFIYQAISAVAFLIHLSMATIPKIKVDYSLDSILTENWQLVTLNLVPLVVYFASIGAMNEINKPISENVKLTAKNSGLDLNNNDFVQSLKIVIVLMAVCQLASLVLHELLWSVILIVPIWCYHLTTKLAQSEYKRFAPSPKKDWAKLNLSKFSPTKTSSPTKHLHPPSAKKVVNPEVKATPRTRTRRAFKNMIDGATEKYQAFEQNVAHQISQKMKPLSPKLKMIET